MRTVASATTWSEIPGVRDSLRGARARLCEATLADDVLRLPFEFVDSDRANFGRGLTGFPTGSVPLLQAYLVVGRVTAHESEGPSDAGLGALTIDYDDAISVLTLSVSTQAVLRISVGALNMSVDVSEQQIGEQPLTMCM